MDKLHKKILSLSLGYLTVTASYAAAPGWFPGDAFGDGLALPPVPLQRRTKHLFTPDEDAQLRALVAEYGTDDWSQIALDMPGRTGRQCRDRWVNYLNPDISLLSWTKAE
ncbi:MAG: SANT/Myb domain-containing protein, partial [Puniceicoccales bacterium]|nr:SANT/Myb domain-containing protein [Puniceicoccales bacterium]